MVDNCDPAGIIELDFSLVSADCKQTINKQHLTELGDRVQCLGNDRYFIPKFIHFQYGTLSVTCPAHKTVHKLVTTFAIKDCGLHHEYPTDRVTHTLQDKEKEKDRTSEGEVSKGEFVVHTLPDVFNRMKRDLMAEFGRADGDWDTGDDMALSPISRRPAALDELTILLDHRKLKGSYAVQDLKRLLMNWTENLDKARTQKKYAHIKPNETSRNHNPRLDGVSRNNSVNDYGAAAKRKLERQALETANRNASQAQGTGG